MWDPYANFESTTLSNDLEVHILHLPGRPWVRVGFQIYSGANQDPPGREGVAHFVEHMVSENTNVSKQQLEDFFLENGGEATLGVTSYHWTRYGFFAPAETRNLAKSFEVFGEMLFNGSLVNNYERERGVIHQEFKRRFPNDLALEQFQSIRNALMPNTRMAHSRALGLPETIEAISTTDLQTFYDLHYTPQNTAIVCVGGKTIDEVVSILSGSPFAQEKAGRRTRGEAPATEVRLPTSTRKVMSIGEYSRGFTGSGLEVHALLPSSIHPEHVNVFRALLSRQLNAEFREKHAWTYGISASMDARPSFTDLSITSNVMVREALEQSSDLVTECVKLVVEDQEGFERQKRIEIADVMMRDHNSSKICDLAQDMLWIMGAIESGQDDIDTISRMDYSDLKEIAQYLMPERRFDLLIKP
ncbi:MAG: mitochondrial-processing peptidase subunit beta [Parcubacteria bacterium C7867-008]|nr:MAG: mitochondrial-processing peptidase subunit beta [Parcubacteria bacterium C7867-008]